MRASLTWKSLVLRGALGVALFAAANVLTYESSGYFDRERGYHDEVAEFFDRPGATAVFAGDSHVAQLDNTLLADNAYNIAWGGDSLREVYAKLRYLIARHSKIDTLFLTADPHMFGDGRLQSSNRAFVDEYLLLTWSPYGLEHGWPSAALGTVPLFNDDFVQYLKKKVSLSLKREPVKQVRQDETVWLSLTDAQREEQARSTGEGDHAGIGAHREPFLWFERITRLAHDHGIQVVAVQYPSHSAYIDAIPPAADSLVNSEIAALGIHQLIDLRNAFSDPSYFADEDHVSRKGAIATLHILSDRTGRNLLASGIATGSTPSAVRADPPAASAAQ